MSKNTIFSPKNTINISGSLIDLAKPKVMGIINITPDSFFAGSRFTSLDTVQLQVDRMIHEGADFIDIGAVSTRPGAKMLTKEEEWDRLKPILKLVKNYSSEVVFSIDTFRSGIAKMAVLDYGIKMINDISGGDFDKDMFKTVKSLKVPYILMHMRGTPEDMIGKAQYGDVCNEVTKELVPKVKALTDLGVADILIDPGFGFAKNIEHNFTMLARLERFKILELPLVVGLSRKSMVYKTLGSTPEQALSGTTVLHAYALQKGANILRVHDVKEAKEAVLLIEKLQMLED